MEDGREPRLRLLAPAAVAVFALLLLAVVLGSGGVLGGGGSTERTSSSSEQGGKRSARHKRRRAQGSRTYTVKAGDTLGSIATRNHTSVERIQELNPQLDPESLTAGQTIRLRE